MWKYAHLIGAFIGFICFRHLSGVIIGFLVGYGLKTRVRVLLKEKKQHQNTEQGKASFTSYRNKSAYDILEIPLDSSWEDIKKAYRRLVLLYHPDKYEGEDDEMKERAENKFRQIQEAYAQIKKIKGMDQL